MTKRSKNDDSLVIIVKGPSTSGLPTKLKTEIDDLRVARWDALIRMTNADSKKDRLCCLVDSLKARLSSAYASNDKHSIKSLSKEYASSITDLSNLTDLVEKLNNDYKAACDAYAECSMRISRYFNTH